MSIRLETAQTIGRNFKDWCQQTLPLICIGRCLSDRPRDWVLLWIGFRVILSSKKLWFHDKNVEALGDYSDSECIGMPSCPTASPPKFTRTSSCKSDVTSPTTITKPLTSMPCEVLSHVGSFLHPKDVLLLDLVLRSAMSFIHRGDDARNNRNNKWTPNDAILHHVWKRLWYRDYGDVLLQWNVGRQAFSRSLRMLSSQSIQEVSDVDNFDDQRLEERLSNRLDDLTRARIPISMKDFYFIFGECCVDYLIARKNTREECFVGLHGHIFEFTHFAEYHPGLVEPILKECGGDATFFFEDLPHSSGARNIARRLCIVVNHGLINHGNGEKCGLELVLNQDDDTSKLKKILRMSNTRPPRPYENGDRQRKNSRRADQDIWMQCILPRRRKLRRPPTLKKIRTMFEQDFSRSSYQRRSTPFHTERNYTSTYDYVSRFFKGKSQRSYYDPLLQECVRWEPNGNDQL